MEALIQKRIRTKEPFAWKNAAQRYDAGNSVSTNTSAPPTLVDDLMRYVTSKAGEKVGIPASEQWTGAPAQGKDKSASNTSKSRGTGNGATSCTSNPTATPAKPMLFEAILNLFAADPNVELYVKDIVEKTMDAVNPADVPPELSSTHQILVALSFLSTPIPGLDAGAVSPANEGDEHEGITLLRDTFPLLPLLENVSGPSTKITWCKYKLANSDRKGKGNDEAAKRKVAALEAAFNLSTVAYQTRYCLTPRLSSTEEEREVLRTGFVPASMDVSASAGATPSNSRPNTPTPTAAAKKKKKDAPMAAANAATAASAASSSAKESKMDTPSASSVASVPTPSKSADSTSATAEGSNKRKTSSEQDNLQPMEPPTKKVAKVPVNADANGRTQDRRTDTSTPKDQKTVPAIRSTSADAGSQEKMSSAEKPPSDL